MRLQDLMKRSVETITEGQSADDAFERMRLRRIRHLVVMDGKHVTGVVSQRDIADEAGRAGRRVRDVMSSPAVTADPEMTVRQAANRLRGHTLGCLPVLEDGKLVGIVTITDLLELLGRGAERPVLGRRGQRR